MATQSKSVLIPFLIIAGIVFSVALAWKILGNHDETTVESATIENSTPAKPKRVNTATPKVEPKVVENEAATPYLEPIIESKEELREKARNSMKFAMRYPTLEKAMDALKQMRNNGNNSAAENLIQFIEVNYPNDTIPAELLD